MIRSEEFNALIADLAQGRLIDPVDMSRRFDAAARAFGSETPDNLAMLEELEIGALPDGGVGLRLKHGGQALSDLLNHAEDAPPPTTVPGLTRLQWEAIARLVTLVFIALETKAPRAGAS